MKYIKRYGLMVAVAIFALCIASADEWDKKTIITTTEPIQLPTVTLQPGTYVFMLDRGGDVNRHIVRVWDKDQQHLITTIFAMANYKIQQTGDTKLTFWETPADQPKALRAWFYPGDNWGQEFMYPKESADRLSALNSQGPVPTTAEQPGNDTNTSSAQTRTAAVTPAPEPTPASSAPAPETQPAPVQVAQAQPNTPSTQAQVTAPQVDANQQTAPAVDTTPVPQETAANQIPDTLPQTASNLPLLGLLGLLSLAAFFVTNPRNRRARH